MTRSLHLILLLCSLLLGSIPVIGQVQDATCDNCNCAQANFATGLGFTQQNPPIWVLATQPPCDGVPTTVTINAGSYRNIAITAGRVYTISLCATSPEVNTVLYVTNTATSQIWACDDDGCGTLGGLSTVQVTTQTNANATVRIYPTLGCGIPTTAPVTVTITCEVIVPANDMVCNATPLPTNSTACNFQLTNNLGASTNVARWHK